MRVKTRLSPKCVNATGGSGFIGNSNELKWYSLMCYCFFRCFEVFVGFIVRNWKIFINWRLINSLFVDCVGATYMNRTLLSIICTMLSRGILHNTPSIFQVFSRCSGPVHTSPFSNENGAVLLRFQKDLRPHLSFSYRFRPSTLQCRICFENAFIPSVRMLKWTPHMRISIYRPAKLKPRGSVCPPFWILTVEWSGSRSCRSKTARFCLKTD